MARQVEVDTFFDDLFEFIKVPADIFRRVCKILSIGIFFNPRWPPRLSNIINMVITPLIFGLETKCLALCPCFDAHESIGMVIIVI